MAEGLINLLMLGAAKGIPKASGQKSGWFWQIQETPNGPTPISTQHGPPSHVPGQVTWGPWDTIGNGAGGQPFNPPPVGPIQYPLPAGLSGPLLPLAPRSGLGNATRLTADELATGLRLENQLRMPLRESPHLGAEFVDDLGMTSFDALGKPSASLFWDPKKFFASIDKHLLKSNNFTVIDLTGFTPAQIAAVERYLATLPPALNAKIIRIGF